MTYPTQLERFQLRKRLGEGSFGVVFDALDHERQVTVALKLLHEPRSEALYHFKQEFRALADLAHPNLVSPYELLSINDQWFFTMELVDGVNFYQWFQREAADEQPTAFEPSALQNQFRSQRIAHLPWQGDNFDQTTKYVSPQQFEAIRPALVQLAEGLHFLHQSGLLHRDLKPSNVLITHQGQVKILDFGLASLREPDSRYSQEPIAGTPAYMAPELLDGYPATPASDWYSVGTILYQVLTGQLPHTGTPIEMAKAKRHYDPCPPSLLLPGVPLDLEALCLDMLNRDPGQRPTGKDILARLGGVGESPCTTHADLSQPALAGRTQEMNTLMDAFHQMRKGRMRIIHLHGAAGMGKSLLVRRFLREVHLIAPDCQVLQGRCYEQESVPFKAMDSLVDALSRHLKHLSETSWQQLLPSSLHALIRLFPVMQSLVTEEFPCEENPQDSLHLRQQAFQTLREILWHLARQQPLLLAIDDIQWGDKDSGILIAALLSPPDPPPLMLLLTSADEGELSSPMMTQIKECGTLLPHLLEMHLRELPWTEALHLATTLLGPSSSTHAAEKVAEESGGSPYLIAEMVRQYQTNGNSPTRELKNYLSTQIDSLPKVARRILEVLSLAACPLSMEALQHVLTSSEMLPQSLSLLRNYHLIRVLPARRRHLLSVYHAQIREVALTGMDAILLQSTHQALALALEKTGDATPDALAVHLEGAGEKQRASEFAALGAQQAATALAFGRACDLYKKALHLSPTDSASQIQLQLQLAECLANAGFSAEAGETFCKASNLMNPKEAMPFLRRGAEEFFRAGHLDQGIALLKTVLHQLGEGFPRTPWQSLLQIFWYRVLIFFQGYRYTLRSPHDISPDDIDRVDTFWAATMGLGGLDMLRGCAFHAKMLYHALKLGEPFRIVRALANEAVFVAHGGTRKQEPIKRILSQTQSLAEELGHPKSLSRALLALGLTALLEGRWKTTSICLARASAMLKSHCTGVDYEIQLAQRFSLIAHFIMGDFTLVAKQLPRLLKEAQERGDRLSSIDLRAAIESPLLLMQDHPELARKVLSEALSCWSHHDFLSQHYHALVTSMNIELYAAKPQGALHILEENWRALKHSRLLSLQCTSITIFELHARTLIAVALETNHLRQRRKYLKSADTLICRIENEKTLYGDALALKLRALEALAEGQSLVAQGFLLQAEHAFEACDMAGHAMAAKHARCTLEGETGKASVESAEVWMQNQGVQAPQKFVYMHHPVPAFKYTL